MKFYLTLLVSLLYSTSSNALILLDPYDPSNPPSTIYATDWPSMPEARYYTNNAFPNSISCLIIVKIAVSPSNRLGRGYARSVSGKYVGKINNTVVYECGGAQISLPFTGYQIDQILAKNNNAQLVYLASADLMTTGADCQVDVEITWGGRTYRSVSACTVARPPVVCNLSNNGDILHDNLPTGTVHSTKRGGVTLNCTRSTSVTVLIEDDNLLLRSGGASINSKLHLNQIGHKVWKGTVDRDTAIEVISTIDDNITSGGEYSGSAVVTATWD
ncbi:Uncharacterised protein [Serratia quinivorans]|nr:Uncharacterised protein [Serratia quinivorans]VEI64011.1 Uncharacterised protein [Serratia quinivorans]